MQELVLESSASYLMLLVFSLLLWPPIARIGNIDGAVLQYYCSSVFTGNPSRLSFACKTNRDCLDDDRRWDRRNPLSHLAHTRADNYKGLHKRQTLGGSHRRQLGMAWPGRVLALLCPTIFVVNRSATRHVTSAAI